MESVLYIQMLGGFSLSYGGQQIALERNSGTKATQLLQYLVFHKGERIHRDKLIDILYNDDDVLNPQNNLKVNIFRLRKLLAASCLPEDEYIVYSGGMYSWQGSVEVEIDAINFEKKAHMSADFRKSPDERIELLLDAVNAYTGEFLPIIASEPWVALESVRYKELFLTCVREANAALEAAERFSDCLELCNRAVKLCPYEEDIHLMRISAFLNMRAYQEALSAYGEASKLFLEDLGISVSQEMLDIYRRISGSVRHTTSLIEEVMENLRKDKPGSGAYFCNFPGFMDSYLFISRMVERSGQSIFLMLSTLTDVHGVPLELGDKLNQAATDLQGAISFTLRRGDLFTRYSPCQFLMLLVGTNRESCDIVAQRVSNRFKEITEVRGVRIQHSFTSGVIVEDEPQPKEMKFSSKNLWNT